MKWSIFCILSMLLAMAGCVSMPIAASKLPATTSTKPPVEKAAPVVTSEKINGGNAWDMANKLGEELNGSSSQAAPAGK